MNTPYHDDLFASAGAQPANAPGEIRIDAQQPAPAAPPHDGSLAGHLRAARAARGMDLAACSQASRLPVRVLQRLEAGDFGNSDDFVFVRGALNSYARLLGIPAGDVDSALREVAPVAQPQLVATGSALRAPWLRRYGAAATYIILTAMVAVPLVWLGLHGGLDNQLTRIAPLDSAPSANAPRVARSEPRVNPPAHQEPPLQASLTPFTAMQMDAESTATTPPLAGTVQAAPDTNAGAHVLSLQVTADSWVEVTDADGKALESGVLHRGEQRIYRSAGPLNVTIGNVGAVQVLSDGKPLSLAPYQRANVARFEVFGNAGGKG